MNTRASDLAAALAARCTEPFGQAHVAPCERTLRIGFFFDGFARHLLKDMQSGRVSNVGKLYMAHPHAEKDDAYINYRRAYISGLGEDYSADLTTAANGALDSFGGEASEAPQEVAAEQAVKGFPELLDGGRSWWERVSRDLGELLHKPYKAGGVLKDAAIEATVEAMAPLRDNGFSAQLLKSGANTRIEGAIDHLNQEIGKIERAGGVRLKRIELSVYGFDYGATLARAFLQQLLGRCLGEDDQAEYQGARLVVLFAGLFDGVDRSHGEIPLVEDFLPVPVRTVLDDGGTLPAAVRQALHLVAAHERRFYRRARLLGEGNPAWREELLPGVSEDVGGSLLPGEQKPSAELARVSLQRMYRAAYSAGVPFPPFEELHEKDADTAQLFAFNDHLDGVSAWGLARHYRRAAQASIAELARVRAANGDLMFSPQQQQFAGHIRLYIRWLAALWRPYAQRLRTIGTEEERLHASQFQSGNSRGMLGFPVASGAQQQTRQQDLQTLRDEREALRAQLGWLETVDSEARALRNRLEHLDGWRAAGTPQQAQLCHVLLAEWFNDAPAPLPQPLQRLFGHFIHDQLVQSTVQRSARSLGGQHYFDIRDYDRPEAQT
ncbi:Uncharacterized alpha/beta hydrolase domain [Pseudomonas sp. 8AS]|uniref:DUF2235 domain-containing protein n=1 Tax=Pseudomonas sp. 8AS TaxID=2653163 RepID=UPI0012F43653|nr:DUF2235 domain-containing protein [Pseudomonas sp. 8AS]VXC25724.1 Uncharacterized alpha/beta hydrolase domain [Pseudomonas sp. 8AS]